MEVNLNTNIQFQPTSLAENQSSEPIASDTPVLDTQSKDNPSSEPIVLDTSADLPPVLDLQNNLTIQDAIHNEIPIANETYNAVRLSDLENVSVNNQTPPQPSRLDSLSKFVEHSGAQNYIDSLSNQATYKLNLEPYDPNQITFGPNLDSPVFEQTNSPVTEQTDSSAPKQTDSPVTKQTDSPAPLERDSFLAKEDSSFESYI